MRPAEFRQSRQLLRLTQEDLANKLKTTRRSIIRYKDGSRRIPGMAQVLLQSWRPLMWNCVVAAGEPIEPIPQTARVEVPKRMIGSGGRAEAADDPNRQTVIALVNGEATIKTYQRKASTVELHPANDAMHPIVLKPTDTFQIEGIAVGVIRHLRK